MKSFLYPKLNPPSFTWVRPEQGAVVSKVHEWIQPLTDVPAPEKNNVDFVVVGVPLSRSSISASGASEFPDAFRRAWKGFTTYNLDEDVDLSERIAVDAGDVPMHVTDIRRCHENIIEASAALHQHFESAKVCAIGGDHSITAMMVKGLHQAKPAEKIGILQFDTHFDLRDMTDNGPSNGTPMRNLIESGVVKGSNMYNIGLHGFFNTKDLKQYADEQGVNYISLRNARKKGIEETVRQCLAELETKVDAIYLTVDMDVLDIAYAPGVPASTPGGMTTVELLEGVLAAARHPKVNAMDIVCLDPLKDTQVQPTVKLGTHVFLTFLTGVMLR
ncbi:agmatinase family protein [Neobacillus vireti]|uniref:Formimidoylglutamase n=1 Tax=Neobacillus vireti LMG 21834 TaxID=1131730 RepID=A0AB94IQH3_9BACI|nr:agmatinase family protein [Neobacillus vireti]ETI69315.1 formimidoylglutamase [Neobacillus vireti LMG 21834]KLT19852.1 formimidoylglutamase [Neobacillus vireti]